MPISDDEEENDDCYSYLRQVRQEATGIDSQLEERKEDDYMDTDYPDALPCVKTVPVKSKGTGITTLDEKWKRETLQHYSEMQITLHLRREEFKSYYPECVYQCEHDLKNVIVSSDTDTESQDQQETYKTPDTDEIARWSEGFLHYAFRNLLDLYEEEWREKKAIPDMLNMWIWSFLIMLPKPLLSDVAADLNDLLSVYEMIKDNMQPQNDSTSKGYTMYDSVILIITEHFEQRFQY